MTFENWWATLTTLEQARIVKHDCAEAWQEAFREGYEKGVAAFHEAVKMEREECANICDHEQGTAGDAADKIRMRSNASLMGAEPALSAERPR